MWLLDQDTLRKFETEVYPTAEAQNTYAQAFDSSGLMRIDGKTATIAIDGVLTDKPDFFAFMFGGGNTTYAQIRLALAEAEANSSVKRIDLAIDSPGGNASAEWVATIDAVAATTKPTTALISNIGTSAAYGIAAQADSVVAENRMTRVGSIGVAARLFSDDNEITVTSTDAPDKIPDARSDDGVATIRKELDAIHAIFVDAVARGRAVTVAEVNADFGRGATILAQDALKRGMIDAIGRKRNRRNRKEENRAMTLDELKVEHADVYRQAVALGTDQERDRANAHLILGEKSGDMKTAIAAITDGSDMTASIQARYMAAAMNRSDVDDREADNIPPVAVSPDDPPDVADEVVALVEQQLGIKEA